MSAINIKDIIEWNDDQLSDAFPLETLLKFKDKANDQLITTMAKNASAHLDMGDTNLYGKDIEKLTWLLNKVERAIAIKRTKENAKLMKQHQVTSKPKNQVPEKDQDLER